MSKNSHGSWLWQPALGFTPWQPFAASCAKYFKEARKKHIELGQSLCFEVPHGTLNRPYTSRECIFNLLAARQGYLDGETFVHLGSTIDNVDDLRPNVA